jgi:hypothetical protein
MLQPSPSQYREFIRLVISGDFERAKELIPKLERRKLLRWIRFHMLGSYLFDKFPEIWELELDRAQTLLFHKILDEMLNILSDSPVEVVVFKGGHIRELYPNRYWRMVSDLDVYVRSRDIKELDRFLVLRGFKGRGEVNFQYRYEYKGVPLEVHTRFARKLFPNLISENVVFENSERFRGAVLFPSPDLEITIFYFHAYKSAYTSGFRAIWWLDERFLTLNGAEPLNISKINRCVEWFKSYKFSQINDMEGNEFYWSIMGIFHALRLWL